AAPAAAPAAAGSAAAPGAATAAGDTSHCVRGKQFGDYSSAPPCVARFTGDNGGATYPGVTAKTVKLVYFREKDNPVVKGLLSSQGLYSDPADQRRFMQAMEDFINKKYELYGRKVAISFWSSPCQAAPPDDSCFRNDARALVAKEKPFAVVYDNNTNTPAFFDELSKLRVVNFGGWHFQDSFNTSHRPYHWDANMGGDFQARLTGDYWCTRLAGHKARYAGTPDLTAKTRKAGIFYPQTDVNTEPAKRLAGILRGCGTQVVEVPYSPDTATASQQATSQVAKLKSEGVTSVLVFGDPIAPAFQTTAETQQAYFPEQVLVGSGLIDYDKLARLYDKQQWANAFGPSDLTVYPAFAKQECSTVWRATGHSGVPYSSAQLPWSYWTIVATAVQLAGPQLDPGTFEQALLSGRGDTPQYATSKNAFVAWTHFAPGDYTAASDAKEAYWDAGAVSAIDGQRGAYVALRKGARYAAGGWPRGEASFPLGG
ncbi:MAG: hypothetical protein JWM64_2222, partial [Frankiales bacterium]|nr:hypothetical protein [Frankiales bacterium]